MTGREIGVVITTYDKFDHARANMELIRHLWSPFFDRVVIVHAVNGPQVWSSYLEDHTVVVAPSASHFRGAASLLDAGIAALAAAEPGLRHAVCLAGDCWLYRPEWVRDLVEEMHDQQLRLAAARFEVTPRAHGVAREHGDPTLLPGVGLTSDFFVLDVPWALEVGMVPLSFEEFLAKYGLLLDYLQEIVLLERYLEGRFLTGVRADLQRRRWHKDGLGSEGLRAARRFLRLIVERPIDPAGITAPPHKGHWPTIGLSTTEDPSRKRAELSAVDGLAGGPTIERFVSSEDLGWFAAGAG
ncbi:hypothetical protein [Actinomycetospora soli]|uniref:hypothetical protein n=1 Tax=Actinomycetospora soli TaxID=2893887 RepID=UPI001E6456AC|nr:hypothetical protein [Actinomycetospora soli]MCD2187864.1 hypothetical protein [Actinomycetospora soli]